MAFASHLLGVPVGWPDFLDGPVLRVDDLDLHVGMGRLVRSVRLDDVLK